MRQITVIADGRSIPRGRILSGNGERIWETKVRESKHLFKRMDSWTISESILAQLRDLEIGRIRFVVTDKGGESYEVSLSEFLERAEPLDQSEWARKTEAQYALPRRFWQRRESAQKQLALPLA
jgi:hypothetical protein